MTTSGEVKDSKSIPASVDEQIVHKMEDTSLKSSFIDDMNDATSNEVFLKHVRDILNKMAPNMFDTVVEDIKGLKINTVEQLNGIMSLIFEKGIFEQTYPFIYTQLYCKLSESIDTELKEFQKAMVLKCQHEFENHVVADDTIVAEKLRPFLQKIEDATDPDEKAASQANYENEQWKLKRRSIGIVRFIGELFQHEMLTPNVMMNYIQGLLDRISENKLECLCELLTIIGSRLEAKKTTDKALDLATYIEMLKEIVENKSENVKVSSRVKFMIQDVIDLREHNWIPRTQMKTAQIESDAERNIGIVYSKRGSRGGGLNYTHSVGDRGGYHNNNRARLPQKFKFKKDNDAMTPGALPPFCSDDSDILRASTRSTSVSEATVRRGSMDNNKTAHSTESYHHVRRGGNNNNWRNDSKRNLGRPVTGSSRKATISHDFDEESKICAIVRELYESSVATHQKSTIRIFAGQVVCNWINQKLIAVDDNLRALKEFLASVLDSDNPMIWVHISEFVTPEIEQNFLSLKQIRDVCNDEYVMQQILQHLIPYLTMEHGPQFVRNLFKECEWSDLISADKVNQFIREHKFEFIKDNEVIVRRIATGPTNIDLIQIRVKEFLNDGADLDVIQEFIAVNLNRIDTEFIRALTTVVIEFSMEDKTFKFNEEKFIAGIPLLTTYIDDNIDFQLECLHAVQMLMNKVEYPKDANHNILSLLYDDQVVFLDVFHMWRDLLEGKSEALSNLLKFFELLGQVDTEKESH